MLHSELRTEYVGFETERARAAARDRMDREDLDREERYQDSREVADEVRLTDLVTSAMQLGAASARYTWQLMMWPMRSAMNAMNNGRKV